MVEAAPEIAPAAPTTPAQVTDAQQRDAAARTDMRMSSAAGRAAAVAGARAPTVDSATAAAEASPALTLLRRSRSELGNGSARWTWMPPSKAATMPMDDAAHDWLARVAQASRARWSDTAERTGPGEALEVRWWRDDWPQATLRIEADGLRWIEHNGRIRYAPLDAATLQRLRNP